MKYQSLRKGEGLVFQQKMAMERRVWLLEVVVAQKKRRKRRRKRRREEEEGGLILLFCIPHQTLQVL